MTSAGKFNAAVKLRLENRLEECQEACDRLWRADLFQVPQLALLRGNLNLDLGNYHDSLTWHELAWAMIAPDNRVKPEWAGQFPEIALPLGYSRLRAGNWDARTWALFEIGRLGRSWHPAPHTRPWDGSPEKMLVLSEGGYGDVFLFTRFFQKLDPIQRAASRLVMGPQFAGLRGFRGEWDGMATVWYDEELNWKSFRFSAALMSLMSVQGISSPEGIPGAEKCALLPPTALKAVALNLGQRLGLCWSAEENGVQKRIRSIDTAADLEPLARWSFVNLNPGKTLLSSPGIPRLYEPNLKNWTETARVIAGLDCVVTVDTAVAHLAGLLGVPTLCILPVASDWKWGLDRGDSFWWPTVTLIRNTSPYTFRPALEKVAERLEKL